MKNLWTKISAFFFLTGLIFLSVVAYGIHSYLQNPIVKETSVAKTVFIPKGTGFNQVVHILSENGLLQSSWRFRLLAQYRNAASLIKAGEFEIQTHWTPDQLLNHLVAGRSQLYKVTIPEGLTLDEISIRLEKAGFGNAEEFRRLKTHLPLRQLIQLAPLVESLEGFLFPETYFFPKGASAENILAAMIQQFNQNYTPADRQKATQMGLSDYEVITLASIIEKETGMEQDRALVSAVFHNRLKRKMRLESDPTVIYGIQDFDGNLTRKHLKTPMPYNTYTNFGLPPGPICNPGKAAIQSTLHPAAVNYLYFVARGDGTSQFSSNLKAHNRAVYRYQKNRKARKNRL